MKIKMKLISDTVFGNGESIPGGEDIAVLCDEHGFPYYKGSTFKGIFREELKRLLAWEGKTEDILTSWLGEGGSDEDGPEKIIFSDFKISPAVKAQVLEEIGDYPERIKDSFTNLRTFTAIDADGVVREGSLRVARCVNAGLTFYSEIQCVSKEQEEEVKEVLGLIKWIGSMRNRGFGNIRLNVE